jgi:predicted ATP-grasp superfamily ATP-dependent carboligase
MPLSVDQTVPALLVKIGHYPLHHGGVGAIRSLGRLGVPVYAVTEGRLTPASASRYLTKAFPWPTTGSEPTADLVAGLRKIAESIPGRAVAVPTDDEAAVLLAEHADELSEHLRLPPVPRDLPRALASKHGLSQLCAKHDVPAPRSALVASLSELDAVAETFDFPLILKNSEPWLRLASPAVGSSTLVGTRDELRALAAGWPAEPHVLVQEYLPGAESTDWIAHICRHAGGLVTFTGVKVRSWPPHAGVTTYAYSVANPELAALTERFCAETGFTGVADLDWRLDHRDGRYKLLDFNPRVGAQFRLFETHGGVDVVRAHHLALSGRPIPSGEQVDGRRFVVEHLDVPARIAYRRSAPVPDIAPGRTELAWLAADDPLPGLVTAAKFVRPAAKHLAARVVSRSK